MKETTDSPPAGRDRVTPRSLFFLAPMKAKRGGSGGDL